MNLSQANNLQKDISKDISECDFVNDIYLTVKGIGTKVFRDCAFHETDDWIFIWTTSESFLINRKKIGDHVLVQKSESYL